MSETTCKKCEGDKDVVSYCWKCNRAWPKFSDWLALDLICHTRHPSNEDGEDDYDSLELRHCPCGEVVSAGVTPELHESAEREMCPCCQGRGWVYDD